MIRPTLLDALAFLCLTICAQAADVETIPGTGGVRWMSNWTYSLVYLVRNDDSLLKLHQESDGMGGPIRWTVSPLAARQGVNIIRRYEDRAYAIVGGQLETIDRLDQWKSLGPGFASCTDIALDAWGELFVLDSRGDVQTLHRGNPKSVDRALTAPPGLVRLHYRDASGLFGLSRSGAVYYFTPALQCMKSEGAGDDNVDLAANEHQFYVLKRDGTLHRRDTRSGEWMVIRRDAAKVSQMVPTSNALYVVENGDVKVYDGAGWATAYAGYDVQQIVPIGRAGMLLRCRDGHVRLGSPLKMVGGREAAERREQFDRLFERRLQGAR